MLDVVAMICGCNVGGTQSLCPILDVVVVVIGTGFLERRVGFRAAPLIQGETNGICPKHPLAPFGANGVGQATSDRDGD